MENFCFSPIELPSFDNTFLSFEEAINFSQNDEQEANCNFPFNTSNNYTYSYNDTSISSLPTGFLDELQFEWEKNIDKDFKTLLFESFTQDQRELINFNDLPSEISLKNKIQLYPIAYPLLKTINNVYQQELVIMILHQIPCTQRADFMSDIKNFNTNHSGSEKTLLISAYYLYLLKNEFLVWIGL